MSRFVMAHSERVSRAAACGAGNYVLLDDSTYFPYGVVANPFAPDLKVPDFGDLVRTPLAVVMGTDETELRLNLAKQFMDSFDQFAYSHNMRSAVEYMPVLNGGHASRTNFPMAVRFLLKW